MLLKKNNKGMTLVETIIGVALLAIASIMLVNGFVATANIVNRATEYKYTSAEVASAIELEEVDSSCKLITASDYGLSNPKNVKITYTIGDNASLKYETSIKGQYSKCTDPKLGLTYEEFIGNNYVNVVPTEDGE